MLLVLLAAAGLPCSGGEVAGRQGVEAVHDAAPPRAARRVVGEPPAAELRRTSPRTELPRALPRTKSVAARGLPPSRAPTV